MGNTCRCTFPQSPICIYTRMIISYQQFHRKHNIPTMKLLLSIFLLVGLVIVYIDAYSTDYGELFKFISKSFVPFGGNFVSQKPLLWEFSWVLHNFGHKICCIVWIICTVCLQTSVFQVEFFMEKMLNFQKFSLTT